MPDDRADPNAGFSLTAQATTRFEDALAAAVRHHDASMRELRSSIEACVDELYAAGMTPERVLVTIKAFVRRTAVDHPPRGQSRSVYAADPFMEDIIRWCIQEYYRHQH